MAPRAVIVFVLILLLGALPAASAAAGPRVAAAPSPTLSIGFLAPVDSLNPYQGINDASYFLFNLLYDQPFAFDQDGNSIPNLITSASCANPQCTAWNYTVRQGVHWSDGTPLTAADVNFTFNYDSQNLLHLWAFEPYFNHVVQCSAKTQGHCGADISAVDPWNVTVYFDTPFAAGENLDAPIVQKAQWQSVTPPAAQTTYKNSNPIGTGPFIADPNIYNEFLNQATEPLHVYRNSRYHPLQGSQVPPINVTDIYLWIYSSPGTLVAALNAGTIQLAQLPPSAYGSVTGPTQTQTALEAIQEWNEVGISQANSTLLNPARFDASVRQALARATNKDYIVKYIYGGLGAPGSSLVSPFSPYWYDPVTGGDNFTFNIAAANQILNASGYTAWSGGSFGNGVREAASARVVSHQPPCYLCLNPPNATTTIPAGTQLAFTLAVRPPSVFPEELTTAEYLQAEWAKIGVGITIKQETTEAALSTDVYNGYVEMYIWYWSSDPDPNYILSMESSWTLDGWNDNYWNNGTYNDLYIKQLGDTSHTARLLDVMAAEKAQYESASYLIYLYPYGVWAMRYDVWTGWGNWAAHPFRQMNAYWSANPLWFSLTCPNCTTSTTNYPPSVPVISPAGPLTVYTHQVVYFNATTSDPELYDTLNWTWVWDDGTHSYVNNTPNPTGVVTVPGSHAWAQAGTYYVSVLVTDGVNSPVPTNAPVTVDVVSALTNPGWINGTVTNAYGTQPIAGAVVTASPGGYTAYSSSNGSYSLAVPAGVYTVSASAPLHVTGSASNVTVVAGQTALVYFALGFNGAWIDGNVTDSVTGLPIAGASVVANPLNGSAVSTVTNAQGLFNLTLSEGTFTVVASATGYTTYTYSGITLPAGQTRSLAFHLSPAVPPVLASLAGAVGRPGQAILLSGFINATVAGNWTLHFGDGASDVGTYGPGSHSIAQTHTYAAQGNVTARLFATSGNDVQVVSALVCVDGTPPSTTASVVGTRGTNGWFRSAVTVTLAALDTLSGVASTVYRIDGGAWDPYTAPFALSGNGNHTVQFASTDRAGNVEPSQSLTVSIDTTPPALAIDGPADGSTVTSSNVQVTWTASDSVSGVSSVEVSVDNGTFAAATGSSFVVQGLGDGAHTVTVKVTDAAGLAATASVSFTVQAGLFGGQTVVVVGGIAAAVIVVAVVVATVLRQRRRTPPPPEQDPPRPQEPPQS